MEPIDSTQKARTTVPPLSSSPLEAALYYLRRGWSVIPVGRDKKPIIVWEPYQRRHPTEEEVWAWYVKWPWAGVGIVCGKISGLIVLDLDPRHKGDESLLAWGKKGWQIPTCPEAKTGGGGVHFYLRHPGEGIPTIPALAPGIDLKSEGSYVVAPPSLHPSGARYQWYPGSSPKDIEQPPPPSWLLDLVKKNRRGAETQDTPGKATDAWRLLLGPICEGERNTSLARLAGWLHLYHPAPVVAALLQAINAGRCLPPLDQKEVAEIALSVCRYPTPGGIGHPRAVVADFVRQEVKNA